MRTDSIKKYLIPNIPYLFIGWACLKLGTAYRLAEGADLPHKLMGLGQTVGPAFADFAPGLDPLDWLIGIVGAVGFRLLIYFKSKKAKKYRRDEEYGSARWGGPKDIAPFVDPKFENNVILTGTEFLTMKLHPPFLSALACKICGVSQNRVLPEPDEPMTQQFKFRALAGFFGRVFMVRNSVPVRMTLFSNLGSTKGFISFSVPKRAEPYSSSRRYFLAFLLFV